MRQEITETCGSYIDPTSLFVWTEKVSFFSDVREITWHKWCDILSSDVLLIFPRKLCKKKDTYIFKMFMREILISHPSLPQGNVSILVNSIPSEIWSSLRDVGKTILVLKN